MLKVYVVGNVAILGECKKKTISGIKVASAEKVGRVEFIDFVKTHALGNLTTVKRSKLDSILEIDLIDAQQIELSTVMCQYEAAAERAHAHLVNNTFDELFSGK